MMISLNDQWKLSTAAQLNLNVDLDNKESFQRSLATLTHVTSILLSVSLNNHTHKSQQRKLTVVIVWNFFNA